MTRNKLALPGALLLAILFFGLPPAVQARDLSTVQTALRLAQDEMDAAKKARDADAQRLAATEKEMARLKEQLEAERATARQSEKRYLESRKRHEEAQAAFKRAWKQ